MKKKVEKKEEKKGVLDNLSALLEVLKSFKTQVLTILNKF